MDNINKIVNQEIFILPKAISKGGSDHIYNLVPTTPGANLSKSNRDLEEWYRKQDYFSEDRLNKIYKYIKYMKDKYLE